MATVTLGSVPTTIDLAEATTNWVGDTFSLEPDIKVQGSNSVAAAITPGAGSSQEIHVSGTWDFSGTGLGEQHVRLWGNITFNGNLQTFANNGWQIYLSDGTNSSYWTIAGSDTYFGSWQQFVIYTGDTPDETTGTLDKSAITQIGFRFKTLTKPRNVPANSWFDAWYYGDGYYVTGGTSGDEIDLDLIATSDLTNAYGIVVKEKNGSISLRGDIQIGNGATTTWFKMDNQEAFYVEEEVNTGLYKFHGNGTGCRIDISDATLKSAGSLAKDKFDFDMSETNLLVCSVVNTKFTNADEIIYKSGQTATSNVYNNCGQITHAGADTDNSTVKNYEGTVDTSALIYNVNADPDGEMDGMTFLKGTSATHAIEFGTTSPLTMTLRGITCSGYNIANAQNDSTFHFKRTSGTINLSFVEFFGNGTYRSDGATVVISNAVSFTLTNVVSGSTFNLDGIFTTDTPAGSYNGTGDSIIQMTGNIPSTFSTTGDVRLYNGTYYETYSYTGISGAQLTGVTPTLSQDFDGSKALLVMIAPKTITADPHVESVEGNQDFEALIANASGGTIYQPEFFSDNTGSGFSRRVSQILDS